MFKNNIHNMFMHLYINKRLKYLIIVLKIEIKLKIIFLIKFHGNNSKEFDKE